MVERGDPEKRGGREGRPRDSCPTMTSCFSIYLIRRELPRGLLSCELECHSIWVLCIYPHELFILMTVSNGTLPAGSTLLDLPFRRPRAKISRDTRTAHPPSGKTGDTGQGQTWREPCALLAPVPAGDVCAAQLPSSSLVSALPCTEARMSAPPPRP